MSIMKHIFKTSFAATLFASTSLFGALALPTIAQAQSHQITMQQAERKMPLSQAPTASMAAWQLVS